MDKHQLIPLSYQKRIIELIQICSKWMDVQNILVCRNEGPNWATLPNKAYPLFELEQLTQFPSLRCLYLELGNLSHMIQLRRLHKNLSQWLPSLVNLEQVTYISWIHSLHISEAELKTIFELDYLTVILTSLPKLKMLTVDEYYFNSNPTLMSRASSRVVSKKNGLLPQRFHHSWACLFISHVQNLSKRFTSLKFLGLDFREPLPVAEILKSFPELKSLELRSVDRLINFSLVQAVPNLEALHLEGWGWTALKEGLVPYYALSRQINGKSEGFHKLCVLELENTFYLWEEMTISSNLCEIISILKNLRVLILSRHTSLTCISTSKLRFFEAIIKLNHLYSLIGVECKELSDYRPKTLQYITTAKDGRSTTTEQTVLEITEHGFRTIKAHSPKWQEAYGTSYWRKGGRMDDLQIERQ